MNSMPFMVRNPSAGPCWTIHSEKLQALHFLHGEKNASRSNSSYSVSPELANAEEIDWQIAVAGESEVGEGFADHAGEFEAVAAEAAGEGDFGVRRMVIENEMAVAAVGVKADAGVDERAVRGGEMFFQKSGECFGFAGGDLAIHRVRVSREACFVKRDFDGVGGICGSSAGDRRDAGITILSRRGSSRGDWRDASLT